ncbi:hypothetical protein RclHR1_01220004 [Rhizophagus clarus]|uniref:Uncharacterized protein n=1 Tax=Rhizophagus clarus TaxID=94130 RepID=A0A2Z6QYF6_9GLOM|nr:hypothetical protein RclHR1_01220004 [Rhizophagus clarus]GES96269.1 hypothetical protein RCL_e26787_RclHR1_01220004 [Rhizophagus clarus]
MIFECIEFLLPPLLPSARSVLLCPLLPCLFLTQILDYHSLGQRILLVINGLTISISHTCRVSNSLRRVILANLWDALSWVLSEG